MVQLTEQGSLVSSQPIQVSPRGFKSNLEVVLNALIQLRLRAVILAKLPNGNSWLEDLKQYSQSISPAPEIYLLSRRSSTASEWFIPVPVPPSHPMRGEYSLLVISEVATVMVVGHREEVTIVSESPVSSEADNHQSEDTDSATKVNLCITLQRSAIQAKLDELQQVFQASLVDHPDQKMLQALVSNWETRLQVPEKSDLALADAILMQHGKQQERLRQQARLYRHQAMNASSLSTQNEALLNTLRLKDDFLSTVGQELRSPLSSIKTALPLLASPILKPHQRQRYLEMIRQGCDRQSSLISGVLDLLQLEQSLATATPEAVDLFDVVPGVVSTYQPIAQEKGIRLAYTVPDTLPAVCCPDSWVRQIVIHLLNNGIRYTESGGEIWVTVQPDSEEMVILNIKDTGIGILPNELPHIFEHFYRGRQLNQANEGAGLGLTIVQQLLLYCGGQITVESQPNTGTHVKVRLPVKTES
ncbi:MAG: ATP-binding protein [Cyanobacteria bacterium P01_F01_bin.86]